MRMKLLTLTEQHPNILMGCCPMCWEHQSIGDQVVWPGRGFHAICLDCARSIAAMGRTTSCAVCRRTFTPERSSAAYCSSACRQAAYRRRRPPADSVRTVEAGE